MFIFDFITKEMATTFIYTLGLIEIIVALTKNLPIIKKIKTDLYVFLVTELYLVLVFFTTGIIEFNVLNSIVWLFVNAIWITGLLTGVYKVVFTKILKINNNFNNNDK